MTTLDDYDVNFVGIVPCLVEEILKEMFGATIDLATEEEIKKAKEYFIKRDEEPDATEHSHGHQQISKISG